MKMKTITTLLAVFSIAAAQAKTVNFTDYIQGGFPNNVHVSEGSLTQDGITFTLTLTAVAPDPTNSVIALYNYSIGGIRGGVADARLDSGAAITNSPTTADDEGFTVQLSVSGATNHLSALSFESFSCPVLNPDSVLEFADGIGSFSYVATNINPTITYSDLGLTPLGLDNAGTNSGSWTFGIMARDPIGSTNRVDTRTSFDNLTFEYTVPVEIVSVAPEGTIGSYQPTLEAVIVDDGVDVLDTNSIALYLNDSLVAHQIASQSGTTTTVSYATPVMLDPNTTYTGRVEVASTGGFAQTNEWTFTTGLPIEIISVSPEGTGVTNEPTLEVVMVDDGFNPVDTNSIALYLNDSSVLHQVSQSGSTTIVSYAVSTPLDPAAAYTGRIEVASTIAFAVTNEWTFFTEVPSDLDGFIYWSNAEIPDGSGQDLVSTNGMLLEAINCEENAATNPTINGVTFTVLSIQSAGYLDPPSRLNRNGVNTRAYQGGVVEFDQLLDAWAWRAAEANIEKHKIINLTAGREYEIQLFVSDDRGSRWVAMDKGTAGGLAVQYGGHPQIITGTFTASTNYLDFTMEVFNDGALQSSGGGHLNAYQIRDLSDVVPDPLDPFSIISIVPGAGSATITWESEAGATYQILGKGSLYDADWSTNVADVASAGDGTTSEAVPTTPTNQFYKVEGSR